MSSGVVLLWTVPVVAVAIAVALVLSRLRTLEDVASDLAREVRRSRDLRPPLAALRQELDRGEALVDGVFAHWQKSDS